MSMTMTQNNQTQSFFSKYKKWIIGLSGIYLLPTILLFGAIIVSIIYSYNNTYSNSYNGYILGGFEQGFRDAPRKQKDNLVPTPWSDYDWETGQIEKKLLVEQKEYLAKFPESERAIKLAEMKQEGIKMPSQKQLEGRFTNGLSFCADYVRQQIDRDRYSSEEEYNNALQDLAWKVGYAEGYRRGIFGKQFLDTALRSFQGR